MPTSQKTGVLLINIGTPASPNVPDVRRYLGEFLSDPRVIDIHPIARWLLVNLIILPFRPAKSAHAYQQVWTPEGSPLLVFSAGLADKLQVSLGDDVSVQLGMCYGSPSIDAAFTAFSDAGIDQIVVVPLLPQYASATTGSAFQGVMHRAGQIYNVPKLQFIDEYFDDAGYLSALQGTAQASIAEADHVLISFHGLPERQIRKGDPTGAHCLKSATCCDTLTATNHRCYRAQCYATARGLAEEMQLESGKWSVAFQSRFGRDPWIQPFTETHLAELAKAGVGRVAIVTPGFASDCLETLEELGIRARDEFKAAGGEELVLAPCLNDSDEWVAALADIVRRGSSWL